MSSHLLAGGAGLSATSLVLAAGEAITSGINTAVTLIVAATGLLTAYVGLRKQKREERDDALERSEKAELERLRLEKAAWDAAQERDRLRRAERGDT